MMGDRLKAFWLGLFIILALGLGAWLVLFLKPSTGDGNLLVTALFSNIEKITKGTLVTYAGKEVGSVKSIELLDHQSACRDESGNLYIFKLILQLDSSVRIFLYDEITFASAGLLGERSIAIIPKAAPYGSPPASDVTCEILYGKSQDKVEKALHHIEQVATTCQETLSQIGRFIETNNRDFNTTLKSVNLAANEITSFIHDANDSALVKSTLTTLAKADEFFKSVHDSAIFARLGDSFDSLNEAAFLFSKGEGTIARLVNSECFYVQLTSVMCELKRVLSDLSNYGLFYQFSSKWQKENRLRKYCTENNPPDYVVK